MRVKVSCFLALFTTVILISGCETAKGTAEGVAVGAGVTAVGAAEGAQRDWQALKKADAWVRKNLW